MAADNTRARFWGFGIGKVPFALNLNDNSIGNAGITALAWAIYRYQEYLALHIRGIKNMTYCKEILRVIYAR